MSASFVENGEDYARGVRSRQVPRERRQAQEMYNEQWNQIQDCLGAMCWLETRYPLSVGRWRQEARVPSEFFPFISTEAQRHQIASERRFDTFIYPSVLRSPEESAARDVRKEEMKRYLNILSNEEIEERLLSKLPLSKPVPFGPYTSDYDPSTDEEALREVYEESGGDLDTLFKEDEIPTDED